MAAVIVTVLFFALEPRLARTHPRYASAHLYRGKRCYGGQVPKIVATTSRNSKAKYAAEIEVMLPVGWSHEHYDNDAARAFLIIHCPEVVDAFECIVPGAYKADIFRVCWLYYGGMYIDDDRVPLIPFDYLMAQSSGGRLCSAPIIAARGVPHTEVRWLKYKPRVELIAAIAIPYQPFFKCVLNGIVLNFLGQRYGAEPTSVTGPVLAAQCFENHKENISLPWYTDNDLIRFYGSDHWAFTGDSQNSDAPDHFVKLWHERKVYGCALNAPAN